MRYNKFGSTDLEVSVIGFGAWGIGGPARVGEVAIGWGEVDDRESVKALKKSLDLGINFYDTADFYGRGHSEDLIGKTFGNREDVIIATKAGHRVDNDQKIYTDYSPEYIKTAVEGSLKRLKRDRIDYFQLHSAKKTDMSNGALTEMLEGLVKEGKIRYYGVSLSTFEPEPEADFVMGNNWGHGMQVVYNIINRHCRDIVLQARDNKIGIIARMPLQFGLLTGKFSEVSKFDKGDHRSFRLPQELIVKLNAALEDVWKISNDLGISKTALSLRYVASSTGISTVIPGIKTVKQAVENASAFEVLDSGIINEINNTHQNKLLELWPDIVKAG